MKPTTVYITKGKHASQPYTVLIQPPKGEAYKLRQRYSRVFTAKRGALRNLDANCIGLGLSVREVRHIGRHSWVTPKGVPIKFVLK